MQSMSRHTDDGVLMYHDFDYVGYERSRRRTPDHELRKVSHRSHGPKSHSGSNPKSSHRDNHVQRVKAKNEKFEQP